LPSDSGVEGGKPEKQKRRAKPAIFDLQAL
jgi:hypothetical protein